MNYMQTYTHVTAYCLNQEERYRALAQLIKNAPDEKRIYKTTLELLESAKQLRLTKQTQAWVKDTSEDILRRIRMFYAQALNLYPTLTQDQHQELITRACKSVAKHYAVIRYDIEHSPLYPTLTETTRPTILNVFQQKKKPEMVSMLQNPFIVIATNNRMHDLYDMDITEAEPEVLTENTNETVDVV